MLKQLANPRFRHLSTTKVQERTVGTCIARRELLARLGLDSLQPQSQALISGRNIVVTVGPLREGQSLTRSRPQVTAAFLVLRAVAGS